MSTHTIFVYDQDECATVRLTMPFKPTTWHDVWLYVLRDRMKDETIQREEVPAVLDDLGDDALDFNIVAVVPGDVQSVELAED